MEDARGMELFRLPTEPVELGLTQVREAYGTLPTHRSSFVELTVPIHGDLKQSARSTLDSQLDSS